MKNVCQVCKIEFESAKQAKTCSPKCRVTLSRLRVTEEPNVTLRDADVTPAVTFEFYTVSKENGLGRKQDEKSPIRKAKYWYDVPLAARPVIKKGWPDIPIYMNGRQYFLWWKNEFETKDENPVILNPYRSGGVG